MTFNFTLAKPTIIIIIIINNNNNNNNLFVHTDGKSPEECCFNFFNKPIPVRSIVSYEETRTDCPKAGVV